MSDEIGELYENEEEIKRNCGERIQTVSTGVDDTGVTRKRKVEDKESGKHKGGGNEMVSEEERPAMKVEQNGGDISGGVKCSEGEVELEEDGSTRGVMEEMNERRDHKDTEGEEGQQKEKEADGEHVKVTVESGKEDWCDCNDFPQ